MFFAFKVCGFKCKIHQENHKRTEYGSLAAKVGQPSGSAAHHKITSSNFNFAFTPICQLTLHVHVVDSTGCIACTFCTVYFYMVPEPFTGKSCPALVNNGLIKFIQHCAKYPVYSYSYLTRIRIRSGCICNISEKYYLIPVSFFKKLHFHASAGRDHHSLRT